MVKLLCINSRLASARRQTLPRPVNDIDAHTRLGWRTSTRIGFEKYGKIKEKEKDDKNGETANNSGSVTYCFLNVPGPHLD